MKWTKMNRMNQGFKNTSREKKDRSISSAFLFWKMKRFQVSYTLRSILIKKENK